MLSRDGRWSCPRVGGYSGQSGLTCFVGTSQAFPQANPKYSENSDKLLMLPVTQHWGSEPRALCRETGALLLSYIPGLELTPVLG